MDFLEAPNHSWQHSQFHQISMCIVLLFDMKFTQQQTTKLLQQISVDLNSSALVIIPSIIFEVQNIHKEVLNLFFNCKHNRIHKFTNTCNINSIVISIIDIAYSSNTQQGKKGFKWDIIGNFFVRSVSNVRPLDGIKTTTTMCFRLWFL